MRLLALDPCRTMLQTHPADWAAPGFRLVPCRCRTREPLPRPAARFAELRSAWPADQLTSPATALGGRSQDRSNRSGSPWWIPSLRWPCTGRGLAPSSAVVGAADTGAIGVAYSHCPRRIAEPTAFYGAVYARCIVVLTN